MFRPNTNIEARNQKQILNSNVQKFKTYVLVICIFGHSDLFRASDLEFLVDRFI